MLNNTITVKISKRPNNIQKLVNHLAKSVRCPQLPVGPIAPRPGPIFPMAEAEAVKDVIKFTTFLKNEANIEDFMRIRENLFSEFFKTREFPPNTLLVVSRLVHESFLIEVETIAAL